MDYTTRLLTENKIELLEPYKGSKLHHKMKCLVCSHVWEATPLSKTQAYKKHKTSGCPSCDDNRRQSKNESIRAARLVELKQRGIVVLDENYDGRLRLDYNNDLKDEKILVRNENCGHEFFVTPLNLIQSSVECGVCGPQKRATSLTQSSKARSDKWKETATDWEQYKSLVTSLTESTYRDHKERINPLNLPRGKAGEDGAYHLDHVVPKRYCFDNNIPAEVCADVSNLQMIGWRDNVGSRNNLKGAVPPIFLKYISDGSLMETYTDLVQGMMPGSAKYVTINDVVVNVYDEQNNKACVIVPLSESHANMKTALIAYNKLTQVGVRPIIIFEDELRNVALVSSKLAHQQYANTSIRAHARQCVIKPCSKHEKKELLSKHHTQGNDNATIAYGAYFNGVCVAVMTFTLPRRALGQRTKKTGVFELSRFCTNTEYRVPGIAKRLLEHFKRNNDWTEIYSYADKRWSDGNLYKKIGFTLVHETAPDYFYVIDGTRKHRWNFRKDVLASKLPVFDATISEYQNMSNNGYHRVWDCGSFKFSMINISLETNGDDGC